MNALRAVRFSHLHPDRVRVRTLCDGFQDWPLTMKIGALLLVHVVLALVGMIWTPYAASQINTGPTFAPPSWTHLFGTDALGRDVYSRVMYGGHIVLSLSLSGTLLGALVGAMVGLASAYVGGCWTKS